MRNLFKVFLLLCVLFIGGNFVIQEAKACSVVEFKAKKAIVKLEDQFETLAMAALGVDEADFHASEFTEIKGNYIHEGPMCPNGNWISARVRLEFKGASDSCYGEVLITHRKSQRVLLKTMGMTKKYSTPENSYKIEVLGDGVGCVFP